VLLTIGSDWKQKSEPAPSIRQPIIQVSCPLTKHPVIHNFCAVSKFPDSACFIVVFWLFTFQRTDVTYVLTIFLFRDFNQCLTLVYGMGRTAPPPPYSFCFALLPFCFSPLRHHLPLLQNDVFPACLFLLYSFLYCCGGLTPYFRGVINFIFLLQPLHFRISDYGVQDYSLPEPVLIFWRYGRNFIPSTTSYLLTLFLIT